MMTGQWGENELDIRRLQKKSGTSFGRRFIRSGTVIARRNSFGIVKSITQKTFVSALSGVMDRRMDEDQFDSMSGSE
eukprot:6213015-Pleurochrysis_carterae.AAC.4